MTSLEVDATRVQTRLSSDYPHIGVYDVRGRKAFAARDDGIERSHGDLFGGEKNLRIKDRYICFWFYPPGARSGPVLGYPIDWSEHNLLVRLEPRWSYLRQILLPAHQTAAVEANITHQIGAAKHLLSLYRQHGLQSSLSVHMIGPRASDSLFYVHRWEAPYLPDPPGKEA